MTLEENVNAQIKEAMKAKNEAALRTLRAIKSAILLEKTAEGFTGSISADNEIKLLQKMAKQRKDALSIFEQQNRADLAAKEQEELAIIETFLPASLSIEELKLALTAIIKELGASSPADMGKVMGAAQKQLAGRADGKLVADTVKALLNS